MEWDKVSGHGRGRSARRVALNRRFSNGVHRSHLDFFWLGFLSAAAAAVAIAAAPFQGEEAIQVVDPVLDVPGLHVEIGPEGAADRVQTHEEVHRRLGDLRPHQVVGQVVPRGVNELPHVRVGQEDYLDECGHDEEDDAEEDEDDVVAVTQGRVVDVAL